MIKTYAVIFCVNCQPVNGFSNHETIIYLWMAQWRRPSELFTSAQDPLHCYYRLLHTNVESNDSTYYWNCFKCDYFGFIFPNNTGTKTIIFIKLLPFVYNGNVRIRKLPVAANTSVSILDRLDLAEKTAYLLYNFSPFFKIALFGLNML